MKKVLVYVMQAIALSAVALTGCPSRIDHFIVFMIGIASYGGLSQYQSFLNLEPLIRSTKYDDSEE